MSLPLQQEEDFMGNLLEAIGYRNLQKGITWGELQAAFDTIRPILETNKREPACWPAALAYLVGIRQGIHQARQRRQRG